MRRTELFDGWTKVAALYFKKSLFPFGGILLLTILVQLGGVWMALSKAAEEGFTASAPMSTVPTPWAPRLEALMSEGGWYPLFTIGLGLMLIGVMTLPLWLSREEKSMAAFWRMPMGRWAPLLGGVFHAFCWLCCFWAAEFLTLLGSFALYRCRVPEPLQIPDALLMTLLRWEPLNGLFPAARPWLLPLLMLELLALGVINACTGLYAQGGGRRGWSFGLVVSVLSLSLTRLLYETGLNPLESWYVWTLLVAGAACQLMLLRRRMQGDPLT